MMHFVAMMEETMAEGLARLFRNNVWRLHSLPESVVSDRRLQNVGYPDEIVNCFPSSN